MMPPYQEVTDAPRGALHQQIVAAVQTGRAYAVATVLAGSYIGAKAYVDEANTRLATVAAPALAHALLEAAEAHLSQRISAQTDVSVDNETVPVFVDVQLPPDRLLIVGAVHIAIPLVTFARTLGFHTVVLDGRSAFTGGDRFAHADQLIEGWPADQLQAVSLTAATYVVALTHDEKIDNPVLAAALRSPAPYVGALGSRKTHRRRAEQLRELGLTDDEINRIHAPIGLNIGAATPEEIALAIMAEIITVRRNVNRSSTQLAS